MNRKIVLDTETTGLKPEDGHRILEIGAVEIIDNKKTGREFHSLINPDRYIPEEVVKIHGIDNAKVKHSPFFKDIVDDFLDFIQGAEIVAHNADFDIKFLNYELDLSNKSKIWTYVNNATCTVKLSKRLEAEHRSHTLDSICIRYGIDLEERKAKGHGALLDSHLLADVFIKMNEKYSVEEINADLEQKNWVRPQFKRYNNLHLPVIKLSSSELTAHEEMLQLMIKKDKATPIFSTSNPSLKP